MQFITTKDICEEIGVGETVELVPEYTYVMGSDVRVKDYFELMPGEVVIKKVIKRGEKKSNWTFIKTLRSNLKEIKEQNNKGIDGKKKI